MHQAMTRLLYALTATLFLFLAGCGDDDDKKEAAKPAAAPPAAVAVAPAVSKPATPATAPVVAATAVPVPSGARYRVAWSHYVGWEPWGYADHAGILKKWADKYGIEVELTLVNDYIESINLYTAGKFDACVMTNMDALTIPAVGGVDSQVVIVGDYSNGNDGILLKNGDSVADLKGRNVNLVELSVSHYLLARALDKNGLAESDLTVTNTSDADIAALFIADPNGAAVTWNPLLMQARKAEGAKVVFDSSQTPGEILDLMVVKTGAGDDLKKALTGAWYETVALIEAGDAEALAFMADASGATVDEFKEQLATTTMYYQPQAAADFTRSTQVRETMELVRGFSFEKGLFGEGAESPDFVGIELDDGSVLGDANNVRMRFTAKYMQMAADGKL